MTDEIDMLYVVTVYDTDKYAFDSRERAEEFVDGRPGREIREVVPVDGVETLLNDRIDETKTKLKETRECDIDDCRYGLSEQEHEHSIISMVAATRELQEVRRRLDNIDDGEPGQG